jgi:hypothetical protein
MGRVLERGRGRPETNGPAAAAHVLGPAQHDLEPVHVDRLKIAAVHDRLVDVDGQPWREGGRRLDGEPTDEVDDE